MQGGGRHGITQEERKIKNKAVGQRLRRCSSMPDLASQSYMHFQIQPSVPEVRCFDQTPPNGGHLKDNWPVSIHNLCCDQNVKRKTSSRIDHVYSVSHYCCFITPTVQTQTVLSLHLDVIYSLYRYSDTNNPVFIINDSPRTSDGWYYSASVA